MIRLETGISRTKYRVVLEEDFIHRSFVSLVGWLFVISFLATRNA